MYIQLSFKEFLYDTRGDFLMYIKVLNKHICFTAGKLDFFSAFDFLIIKDPDSLLIQMFCFDLYPPANMSRNNYSDKFMS